MRDAELSACHSRLLDQRLRLAVQVLCFGR
jgi:hypothetical protein